MPIVSVIIPTYNREHFIAECIQSVLSQTFQDFEIIITDNCSTDRTVEIIESFDDRRIKLFRRTKNMGAAESTNNCIRESSGKYIAWLASDDAWYPRKLEVQVKYLDEHPDIAAVFGKVDWVNESGNLINNEPIAHKHVFDYRNRTRLEWLRRFFEKGNCLCIPSSLVRKKCYTEIGLYNPALAVLYDFDFWIRICLKYEIMILDETLVRYRWMSDNSNESGNTRSTHIKSRFEYFEVLEHYLTITDPDEFLLIFPDATKYGKVTTNTIPYFLGRIAIDSGFEFKVLWGQETIFNLLQNEKTVQILEENCNFTYMDFINIVREHDVFKIFVTQDLMTQVAEKEQVLSAQVEEKERAVQALSAQVEEKERVVQALSAQVEEKERAVQALSAQVEEKERKLSEIYQSRAWWMVMFLRNIGVTKQSQEEKYLALLRASELFDESWYLSDNPDVARANIDPSRHYLVFGGFEGRNPSLHFNSNWYLGEYEDVRKAKINPLIHYLLYGKAERRSPLPPDQNRINGYEEQGALPQDAETPMPSNGDRNKNPRRFLGEGIKILLVFFDKSKRAKIIYHLKNYGPVSLIKIINGKLKASFEESGNGDRQSAFDVILSPVESNDVNIRQWAEYNAKAKLRVFFKSNAVLEFPAPAQPMVSIILLFHNRAEMSLQCLETLAAGAGNISFEVVIVDNASTDETSALLDRIRNAKIVRNSTNSGFGGGCNQAVDLAIGKYLLFLNNDTQLLPNSIKVMADTLEGGTNIGAVGGKLVFPDGRLQEAGSIIWQDGSCAGYGRNDDPFKSEFSYMKDVDFCSGALLLTPRDLFLSLGKFDARYAPAYYEDADYCLQLWSKGYRVVFQPFATAIHYEFGSSGMTNAIALQIKNREKFIQKWQNYLAGFDFPEQSNIISSREHKTDSKRILFIDDQIPDYRLGSGYPRTYQILQMLAEMGYKLTFLPMQIPTMAPEITQSLQLKGIEILYRGAGQKIDFEAFLKSRQDYYDVVFVSRPHNMQEAIKHLENHAKQTPVVYDAEAIFALRDIEFDKLNGKHMTEAEKEKLIRAEVTLIDDANVVTTVSEMEKEQFVKHGASSVQILGHVIEPKPTFADFEERKDILFVGGILGCPSPNEDAVRYFVSQILPLVRQEVNCELYIVGTNRVQAIWDLASDYIHVVGKVDDLTSYYNRCRLFVVPTRYSAGISLKLLEASAHGLPSVVTPLTAKQLAWQEDRDILVGHGSVDFARKVIDLYTNRDIFYSLRQNALDRIREEYSPEHFRKNLEHIINLAIDLKKGPETI